jgi:hypothetical protein
MSLLNRLPDTSGKWMAKLSISTTRNFGRRAGAIQFFKSEISQTHDPAKSFRHEALVPGMGGRAFTINRRGTVT